MNIFKSIGARTKTISDGFVNAFTGLGVKGKDKRLGGQISYVGELTEREVEEIYAADSLAARIVDVLPDEATRAWLKFEEEDRKVDDEIDTLDIKRKVNEAWKDARLYGGGGLFLNTGDPVEKLIEPLDENNIKKLISLIPLNRHELIADSTDIETDMSSSNYDKPKTYRVQSRTSMATIVTVHHSRIVRFDGKRLPKLLKITNQYWGASIYTALWDVLRDYGVAYSGAANVVQDFRLLVYKAKGLIDALDAGEEKLIKKRLENMNLSRSVIGSYMLDEDESMESMTQNLAGLADLIKTVKDRLQSATDIPHTKLFNEAPGGLGQSGRTEETIWFDHVSSQQENYLTPVLDRIFKIMFLGKAGPTKGIEPEGWTYDYNPLWQMTDVERAGVEKTQMETDQGYVDMGVKTSEEVRENRFPELDKIVEIEEPEPVVISALPEPVVEPENG
jgi:phage-related protein (TIGR01555 family)